MNNINTIAPNPPSSPLDLSREAQQPELNIKPRMVKPNDEAMRILSLFKPKTNKVIGTDEPKEFKSTNKTIKPSVKPVSEIPIKRIQKFLLPALAGWYISDSLTRGEKERRERQLESEWERALDRQKKPVKKSKWDELVDYFIGEKI